MFVFSFVVYQFSMVVYSFIALFHFVQESGEMLVVVADFGLARVVRDKPMSPMNRISATLPPSPSRKPLYFTGNKPPPHKKR